MIVGALSSYEKGVIANQYRKKYYKNKSSIKRKNLLQIFKFEIKVDITVYIENFQEF
jgi:hypothetical protein